MSTRRQSKRATFASRQRRRREADRIIKANRGRPGFIGVARNVTITTPDGQTHSAGGAGALFIGQVGA